MSTEPVKVFVTYCWSPEAHQQKVFWFVDRLRADGFYAEQDMDIMARVNNIQKMMTIGFGYDKVVVVLSEGYKKSADGNIGGVGQEAPMVAAMKNSHPDKFVFVSLDEITRTTIDKICPHLYAGENIIDLTSEKYTDGYNLLYSKLYDEPLIERDPVLGPRKQVTKVHSTDMDNAASAKGSPTKRTAADIIAKYKVPVIVFLCIAALSSAWLIYSSWKNSIGLISSQFRVIGDIYPPLDELQNQDRNNINNRVANSGVTTQSPDNPEKQSGNDVITKEGDNKVAVPGERIITSAHRERRFIESDFILENRSRNSEIIKSANIVILENTPDPHAVIEYHYRYDMTEYGNKYMIDNISVSVTNKGFGDAFDCEFTLYFPGTQYSGKSYHVDELLLGETKELCVLSKEGILEGGGSKRTETELTINLNYTKANGKEDALNSSLSFRNWSADTEEYFFIEDGDFWVRWISDSSDYASPLEPQTKYLCIIDSDEMFKSSGVFIKAYPTFVRVLTTDDYDRFLLYLSATKSCKLKFRVDFILGNGKTISSEVFEGDIYLTRLYTEKDSIIDPISAEEYKELFSAEVFAYPGEGG